MYFNYKIFSKNFSKQYTETFYQYYLKTVYGNNVVSAESIIEAENE